MGVTDTTDGAVAHDIAGTGVDIVEDMAGMGDDEAAVGAVA
jgi:hypothetical protein